MKKVILLFLMLTAYAYMIKAGNITFDFYKESYENGGIDKIGGFLYMKAGSGTEDNNFYFHITYPVNQILTFTKKEMQIYYPDEKKAIIIENKSEVSNGNFMDPATKRMDLSNLGFKLVDTKKSMEDTKELWASKNIVESPVKSVLIERDREGLLLKMEMTGKNGNIMTRLEYRDYTKIANKEVPLFIKTYAGGEKDSYEEIIKLSNVKENSILPKIIQNFEIPKDAVIKRIKF